jgi:hypothetical protein
MLGLAVASNSETENFSPRADDARLAAAQALLPLAKALLESAKGQADAIGRTERRFGSPAIMHLARLLDDLWMAADSFVADVGTPD